jgi:hypothetical protein
VVTGRADSLVGIASTASEGVVGTEELYARPLLRSAEVLEAVPGVAMTQHSTGGHAPIILLRGYNLDHGTDFATSLEGVPINLPSHAHAQGYTDLNFLMTELIDRLTFDKGPYRASVGDFGTAGSSNIELKNAVDAPTVTLEAGSFGQARLMADASRPMAGGTLLAGIDLSHTDGPSTRPDDFRRTRGLLRYSRGTRASGYSLSFIGYGARWFGSDGYPVRAAQQGWIPRYGSLDSTDGGKTARFLGIGERRWSGPHSLTTVVGFVQHYALDLFSNLTFHTVDVVNGDQIHQHDQRLSVGGSITRTQAVTWLGRPVEIGTGLQMRDDAGTNALYNTVARVPTPKMADDGTVLPATMFDHRFSESSLGPWFEARVPVASLARATVGIRADVYRFSAIETVRTSGLLSPKVGIVLGPWRRTEVYANLGRGFHSDHALGIVINGATPLVRTVGGEVGVRTSIADRVQSSVSLWGIDSDSELIYVPDSGVTEPSRPGRRYGVEWLNYWRPWPWLALDADVAISRARFRTDPDGIGTYIPDAIAGVYTAGMTIRNVGPWSGSLRGRYLGSRALVEDNRVRSTPSFTLSGEVCRTVGSRWTVTVEGFNLLGRVYDDITYYFATRLRNPQTGQLESGAIDDFVAHPADPRSARLRVSVRF